ncbi:MAG: hypothetical protein VX902_06785, partial [Planctomycetota bacterium]|nr:hypothetical protein [Planctomycetota bacterium]
MSLTLSLTQESPDGDSNDYFGSGVAMSEDGTRMIVGAKGDQNNDIGQCHIYHYSGGSWSLEASIHKGIGSENDLEFGFSVAMNANGDRVAVGAPDSTDTSTSAKDRVYIYSRSGTSWSLTQTIVGNTGEVGKQFGYSVAMSGDGNVLLIGIPGYSSNKGCVRSFLWQGSYYGNFNNRFTGPASSAYVGRNIAINYDGSHAIIPIPAYQTIDRKGRVHLLSIGLQYGNFSNEKTLTGSSNDDHLGVGVSINKDGDKALIGQQGSGGTNRGSVFYYTRSGTTWTQRQEITASDAADGDRFCMPIISGDGTCAYVANKDGKVYKLSLSGTTWSESGSVSYSSTIGSSATERAQLAISEDGTTFALGSETAGVSNQGQVFVYSVQYEVEEATMSIASLPDGQSIPDPSSFLFLDESGP